MTSYPEDFDDWLTMPPIDDQCMNALMGSSTHHCSCGTTTASRGPTNASTQPTVVEQPALPSIQWQWRDETVSAGEYQDLRTRLEADIQALRNEADRAKRLEADVEKLRVELASHLQYTPILHLHARYRITNLVREYQTFTRQTRELGHFTRVLRDHVKELINKGNPGVLVLSPKRDIPKKE